MRIGVDIDGVCYMWEKTARYMLREILPDSPYKKDGPMGQASVSWQYIQNNVSDQHWRWLWSEGVRLGLFRHGHMYPGTIKAIRRLFELGDVVFITKRPKSAEQDTIDWLAYHRMPPHVLHVTQTAKSSITPHCDIYVDDNMDVCLDLRDNATGTVVVMHRPWNQFLKTAPNGRLRRAYDWQQFVDIVEDLA